MGKEWNGEEFFKMMAANEQAVGALYRVFASNASLGGKFFENLAKDEDRHYAIYTALLTKYQGSKGLTVEISEDRQQYLNLLIENNLLKDADPLRKKAAAAKNADDMYDLAERAERDSVLFVEELIQLFPKLQPEDFQVVLNEEKDHLKQVLSRRMESRLKTLRL